MSRARFLSMTILAAVLSAAAPADPPAPEFKIYVRFYGADEEPQSRSEIVAYKGLVYEFPDGADEFLVYDPAEKTCTLVDRRRRVFARVAPERLEASMATLRRKLRENVDKKEKSKDRGDRVEARIHRDLIEPKFVVAADPAGTRLKFSNGSVQVDAEAVAEPVAARLALFRDAEAAFVKLGALRDSDSIPPFTRLDALADLFARKLRPVDMTFIYRLTGPPIKYRWTYQLEEKLEEKDLIAMSRIERSRATMRLITFAEYDKAEKE